MNIEGPDFDRLATNRAILSEVAEDRTRIRRLTNIIRAILDADERGQGTPYAEAMDAAAKEIGWKST